jgi:hypothetical protein
MDFLVIYYGVHTSVMSSGISLCSLFGTFLHLTTDLADPFMPEHQLSLILFTAA